MAKVDKTPAVKAPAIATDAIVMRFFHFIFTPPRTCSGNRQRFGNRYGSHFFRIIAAYAPAFKNDIERAVGRVFRGDGKSDLHRFVRTDQRCFRPPPCFASNRKSSSTDILAVPNRKARHVEQLFSSLP
ncbi:hypothetical protein [Paenibacillus cisolokensis]|uniref:hypothetical protein n=1 Tax=Paenibacillus cisolokensis TaxID=1658519 RepID=UPI001BCF7D0E|nr:hypothetical protein [Paenibacillus cisolokensis]